MREVNWDEESFDKTSCLTEWFLNVPSVVTQLKSNHILNVAVAVLFFVQSATPLHPTLWKALV